MKYTITAASRLMILYIKYVLLLIFRVFNSYTQTSLSYCPTFKLHANSRGLKFISFISWLQKGILKALLKDLQHNSADASVHCWHVQSGKYCTVSTRSMYAYTIYFTTDYAPVFVNLILSLLSHPCFPHFIPHYFPLLYSAGDTRWRSGWGTALQTGRSRDRFPMV
jgi:predicted PurR-regulated permease PerM